jgi:transposase
MARFDLTDFEWSVIAPLLPNKPRGVARVDDRRILNGIFWRLRTGAPWADTHSWRRSAPPAILMPVADIGRSQYHFAF